MAISVGCHTPLPSTVDNTSATRLNLDLILSGETCIIHADAISLCHMKYYMRFSLAL